MGAEFLYGYGWKQFDTAGLFVIPATATLIGGELVFDRVVREEVHKRWPSLPRALGARLLQVVSASDLREKDRYVLATPYDLLVSERWPEAKLALFQVRADSRDPWHENWIVRSSKRLAQWCAAHPDQSVHLIYPTDKDGSVAAAEPILTEHLAGCSVAIWRPASEQPFIPNVRVRPGGIYALVVRAWEPADFFAVVCGSLGRYQDNPALASEEMARVLPYGISELWWGRLRDYVMMRAWAMEMDRSGDEAAAEHEVSIASRNWAWHVEREYKGEQIDGDIIPDR